VYLPTKDCNELTESLPKRFQVKKKKKQKQKQREPSAALPKFSHKKSGQAQGKNPIAYTCY
jgi:hypothetical protein